MSEVVLLGQTVNSYNDGTHDFADLLRAVGRGAGHPARALHQPAPERLQRSRDRRAGRGADGVRARAPADAERLDAHAQAHAAPLHARGVSRVRRAAARRRARPRAHDGHHRRLPRRDGRGVRGDAERRRASRLRRRVHVHLLAARRHAGDAPAAGARGAGRGGERAAAASRRDSCARARASAISACSARATKCSSSARRSAARRCS